MCFWVSSTHVVLRNPVLRTSTRTALILSGLVVLSSLVALAPIHDAATGLSSLGVHLTLPWHYRVWAPFCSVLDALSVLSIRQHIVLLATYIVGYAAWRIVRRASLRALHPEYRRPWRSACLWETGFACIAVVAWVGIYVAGALVPRPMSSLTLADPDAVTVDFHSHTNASWDGVKRFTAEANRAWHREAGFDVAYISDHATVAGALQGMRHNPVTAGSDVVLLPAVEARYGGQHIIAMGIRPDRDVHADGNWREPALKPGTDAPMLMLTIPGNLSRIDTQQYPGLARLAAIELADAAPRGIDQLQRQRRTVLDFAARHNIAVIASSDNHGWGSTAAAWSVLHIPNWRSMSPTTLDAAIQRAITQHGRSAVQVLARRAPDPGASVALLALTPVAVSVNYLRTLSWPERASWLGWIWAVWCVVTVVPITVPVRRPVADEPALAHERIPELVPETVADDSY